MSALLWSAAYTITVADAQRWSCVLQFDDGTPLPMFTDDGVVR